MTPPIVIAGKLTNVTVEQFQIAAPFGIDKMRIQGGDGSINGLKLDGIYALNAYTNVQAWNDTGIHVMNLRKGDVVHAVHLDSNLNITSSSEGKL